MRDRVAPVLALMTCVVLSAAGHAQDIPTLPPPPTPASPAVTASDEVVENYLAERQLLEVLAIRLRRQQKEGSPEEQVRAAELLGKLYVRMLSDATTSAQRQLIEAQCRELMKDERANTFELRLALGKAAYLKVEEILERDRLRLASSDEKGEADRVLRTVRPTFDEIGRKLEAKVRSLEVKERSSQTADMEALRAELADSRRLRSLAWYYAGWSHYYTAYLTNSPQEAQEAMRKFGGLLNAVNGEKATIDRLPKNMLRYEHVARAAMGCALCASLLKNDIEASRWLDEVEQAEEVPPIVLDQLFSRRIIVHGAAKQWADIERAVRLRRQPDRDEPVKPLSLVDARLLAVVALETAKNSTGSVQTEAERQAQVALGDLVQRGEAGHVLDLVSLYGTSPMGEQGFIVNYVRSLQAYDKARQAHKVVGKDEEPASDSTVINLYREAATLIGNATASEDAAGFPKEREKAEVRHGLALFYAGDMEAASRQFQFAASNATAPESKRDALWFAIVALDRAVEQGNRGLTQERDRLATLYLEQFPATENAAKLLLRQTRADRLTDAQALEILLKVSPDSGIYEASRKQAARLLYQAYRKTPQEEKDAAAVRFADIAEGLLRLEQQRAMADRNQVAKEAAADVVIRARQLADALLGMNVPDVGRVESALAALDAVASFHSLDLSGLEGELTFRRVQIAVTQGDEAAVVRNTDKLRVIGGPYADAADRVLYRRALRLFRQSTSDLGAARQVIRYGRRVLDANEGSRDAAVVSMRDAVANAAAVLWRTDNDREMRDYAIKLDAEQLEAGQRTASSLRRLGELLEAAGDKGRALTAWRELLNGLQTGTPEWYEARYESLRMLHETSPAEAADVMKQHKVLHPEFGPEPWGEKLRALDVKMRMSAPVPAGTAPGAATSPAPVPSPAAPSTPTAPATPPAPATPTKGGGG